MPGEAAGRFHSDSHPSPCPEAHHSSDVTYIFVGLVWSLMKVQTTLGRQERVGVLCHQQKSAGESRTEKRLGRGDGNQYLWST